MTFSISSGPEDPFIDSNSSDLVSDDTLYERFTNQMLIPLRLLQEFSKGKSKSKTAASKVKSVTASTEGGGKVEDRETLMKIVAKEFSGHVEMSFNAIRRYGVRKAIADLRKEMETSLPALPQDLLDKLEVQKILPTHPFTSDYTLVLARKHGIKETVKILQTDILASLEDDYHVEKTINGYDTEYKVTNGTQIMYITKRPDEPAIIHFAIPNTPYKDSEKSEFATAVEVIIVESSLNDLDKLISDASRSLAQLSASLQAITQRLDEHKSNINAEDANLAAMKQSLARIEKLKADGKREFEERIRREERFEASERAFFETMAVLETGKAGINEGILTEEESFPMDELCADSVDASSTVGWES